MKKELVIILGGMIFRTGHNTWRSSEIDDPGDRYGVCDDILRVEAAILLFNKNADQYFLISGGKGQLDEISDAPTIAGVLKNELIRNGIPEEKILLEENSKNTFTQLHEIAKMSFSSYEKVLIITNECHVPRVETMLSHDPTLRTFFESNKVNIKSAEEILLSIEPEKWYKRINETRQSSFMAKRMVSEKKGIKDFIEGKYRL